MGQDKDKQLVEKVSKLSKNESDVSCGDNYLLEHLFLFFQYKKTSLHVIYYYIKPHPHNSHTFILLGVTL